MVTAMRLQVCHQGFKRLNGKMVMVPEVVKSNQVESHLLYRLAKTPVVTQTAEADHPVFLLGFQGQGVPVAIENPDGFKGVFISTGIRF